MVLRLPDSYDRIGIWKCWFWGRGENRRTWRKNLSEQRREPTSNSTHIWHRRQDMNRRSRLLGGEPALTTVPPLLPSIFFWLARKTSVDWKRANLLSVLSLLWVKGIFRGSNEKKKVRTRNSKNNIINYSKAKIENLFPRKCNAFLCRKYPNWQFRVSSPK